MALPYAISLATAVGELMVTAFNAAKPVIDLVIGALQFLAPIMGVTLVAQMTLLQGVIQAFTLLLKGDFSGAWAVFKTAAQTAFNLLKVGWDALWAGIKQVWDGAAPALQAVWDGWMLGIRAAWDGWLGFKRSAIGCAIRLRAARRSVRH